MAGKDSGPHHEPDVGDRGAGVRRESAGDARRVIVCLDFDGTLVDDEGGIHPADVEALANERSVAFVPATGRPLHSVRRTFERHGLFVGRPIPFPLVLENGAAVYSENEVLRLERSFDPDLQDALMRTVLGATRASFLLFGLDEVRVLRSGESLRAMVRRFDLQARPFDPDEARARPLSKVAATAEDPETLRAFEAEIEGLPLERTYSLPDVLEITPVGVHKGRGLAALLGDAGNAGAEVLVAGDGENDLALFDLATLCFVPEGSPPAIRARADRVIDVREEGLLTPILREIGARR